MRVLVVEDQQELAETVATGLRREGMAVDVALDGGVALRQTAIHDYDVVVLDRDLPVCTATRVPTLVEQGCRARVLMLTASTGIEDRVVGLGLGADDYLPKPFAFAELVARIRALARRAQPALPPVLACGDLRLDPARRIATGRAAGSSCRPRSLRCSSCCWRRAARSCRAEELLERGWDEAADPFSNVVKVTISRLRRKLGEPALIETVPGAGYRI